jgi:hypothetical protein
MLHCSGTYWRDADTVPRKCAPQERENALPIAGQAAALAGSPSCLLSLGRCVAGPAKGPGKGSAPWVLVGAVSAWSHIQHQARGR